MKTIDLIKIKIDVCKFILKSEFSLIKPQVQKELDLLQEILFSLLEENQK